MTETCSHPPNCPSTLVPGTVPLWEAVGSCMQPGRAACSRTKSISAWQLCSALPHYCSQLIFVPYYSSIQGWRPGIGVVHFIALA